jgi:hypothetical protein
MMSDYLPLIKTAEQSYKKYCITNTVDGTENILQDVSDLDCPDLKVV